jgi:hypothetical protein
MGDFKNQINAVEYRRSEEVQSKGNVLLRFVSRSVEVTGDCR